MRQSYPLPGLDLALAVGAARVSTSSLRVFLLLLAAGRAVRHHSMYCVHTKA